MSEFNHVSQAVLAILLGLSLSACTQTGNQTAAETAAAQKTTVTETEKTDTAAGAPAESAETDETQISAESTVSDLQTAFNEHMDAIASRVFPGSAGSTLNAAYQGAEVLSWYEANAGSLTADDLQQWADAYVSSADDPDTFKEQLNAVASWISSASTDDARGALADSGWSGEADWSEADCTLVGQALTVQ